MAMSFLCREHHMALCHNLGLSDCGPRSGSAMPEQPVYPRYGFAKTKRKTKGWYTSRYSQFSKHHKSYPSGGAQNDPPPESGLHGLRPGIAPVWPTRHFEASRGPTGPKRAPQGDPKLEIGGATSRQRPFLEPGGHFRTPLQTPIRRAFTACVPVWPRYGQLDTLRPLEAQLAKSRLPRGTSWVPVWSPPEARYTPRYGFAKTKRKTKGWYRPRYGPPTGC